jgi:uncharacterized protein
MCESGAVMMSVGIANGFGTVVMQPTTLCNMNCSYCYLPDRRVSGFLKNEVAQSVANALLRQAKPTNVLWHGGEPLAAGIKRFSTYLDHFFVAVEKGLCQHSLQTNATLINQDWCQLFLRHRFRVGVSLDGGGSLNAARRFWNNRSSLEAATRGISHLRASGIRFGIIGVVNESNIDDPEGFYESLLQFEPRSISINIEEIEGANVNNPHVNELRVQKFWNNLFVAWRNNPVVPIRQFRDILSVIQSLRSGVNISYEKHKNIYPTIDVNGNVVVLSPEFASALEIDRKNFIVGNVLNSNLEDIIDGSNMSNYVNEFFSGVNKCQSECGYFVFCGGGQASNKYFEHGNLNVTETRYCRSTKKYPVETVLSAFERKGECYAEVN